MYFCGVNKKQTAMKRIVLLAMSALLFIGNINAQEDQVKKPQKPRHVTYEQMTKQMVKELQLNEKQQKKVAKLNKKYKKLIEGEQQERQQGQRPPMGGRPGGGSGGFGGGMPGGGGMGAPGGDFSGGMPGGGGPGGMGMPGGQQQEKAYDYDKQQAKYDKALGKLLSEEQLEGYQKLKPQFFSQRRIKDFLFGGQQGEMFQPSNDK